MPRYPTADCDKGQRPCTPINCQRGPAYMPTSTLDCSCVHYASPTRLGKRCKVSTPADALIFLDGAAAENPVIPWKLDWHSVISRLRVLVLPPERLHQRWLNACGPAVFFRIWVARDPLGDATLPTCKVGNSILRANHCHTQRRPCSHKIIRPYAPVSTIHRLDRCRMMLTGC